MDDQARQHALEDAVRDAVATHAQRAESPREPRTPPRQATMLLAIVTGWAVIGWIWLAQPAALFGPAGPAAASPAEREARLRFGMYLQHQEIVAFMADSGRLPHSLEEAAIDPSEHIRWEFDAQGEWTLEGTDGELRLRLTEGMAADSFLGSSLTILREAR